MTSVPNKFLKAKDELSVKAKAKDLTRKAKSKDLTRKANANAKDSKVVLEDTSRTKAKDNNTVFVTLSKNNLGFRDIE